MTSKTHRYIQIGEAIKRGLPPHLIEPSLTREEMELYHTILASTISANAAFDFLRDIENE